MQKPGQTSCYRKFLTGPHANILQKLIPCWYFFAYGQDYPDK